MSDIIRKIVDRIGGQFTDGGYGAVCPGPGHSRDDRSMSIKIGEKGQLIINSFSSATPWQECRRWLEDLGLIEKFDPNRPAKVYEARPPKRDPLAEAEKMERCRFLWLNARSPIGTLGETYHLRRGLSSAQASNEATRFLERLEFSPYGPSKDRPQKAARMQGAPALINAISAPNGSIQGLNLTYLNPRTGDRRREGVQKLMIGRFMGGAVRLAQPDTELLVAEGYETTQSASRRFGLPGWALLGERNFYSWVPPTGVRTLLIAADNNPAGEAAAEYLAARAESLGIRTRIETPNDIGFDWNDYDKSSSVDFGSAPRRATASA